MIMNCDYLILHICHMSIRLIENVSCNFNTIKCNYIYMLILYANIYLIFSLCECT